MFNLLVENELIQFEACEKQSKKKKALKSLNKIKGDEVLNRFSVEFKTELSSTMTEISNYDSKDYFTTLEKNYDKVIMEDETSDSEEERHRGKKSLGIDIHIKNASKLTYETVVLDN